MIELCGCDVGQLTGHFHVCGILGKTHSHIVGLEAHGGFDVFHVFGRQGWRGESAALLVDALVVGQLATQFDGGVNLFTLH